MKNLKSFNEMFWIPNPSLKKYIELESYNSWEAWEEAVKNSPEFQKNLKLWPLLPSNKGSKEYFNTHMDGHKLFNVIMDKAHKPYRYFGFFLTHSGEISHGIDNNNHSVKAGDIDPYFNLLEIDKKELD